jgi:hypothetical protein
MMRRKVRMRDDTIKAGKDDTIKAGKDDVKPNK